MVKWNPKTEEWEGESGGVNLRELGKRNKNKKGFLYRGYRIEIICPSNPNEENMAKVTISKNYVHIEDYEIDFVYTVKQILEEAKEKVDTLEEK